MRASAVLLVKRRPLLSQPPFKELMPLRLKDRVAGKGLGRDVPSCLQEMTTLFSCLSTHDFQESACAPEVVAFQACYKADNISKYTRKQQRMSGSLEPNQKRLEREQVNRLLRKYPSYYEHKSNA